MRRAGGRGLRADAARAASRGERGRSARLRAPRRGRPLPRVPALSCDLPAAGVGNPSGSALIPRAIEGEGGIADALLASRPPALALRGREIQMSARVTDGSAAE